MMCVCNGLRSGGGLHGEGYVVRATFDTEQLRPRRGSPPEIGNVYSHMKARYYKVVLGIGDPNQRWNCVHLLHVDATGEVVGTSSQPIPYVQNYQDLVGKVKSMPNLKIEWLK